MKILCKKFKEVIKRIFHNFTGFVLVKSRNYPHGINPFIDIDNCMDGYKIDVIFDVGANIGQNINLYKYFYPESQIYCFEPVTDAYNKLKKHTTGKTLKSLLLIDFVQIIILNILII